MLCTIAKKHAENPTRRPTSEPQLIVSSNLGKAALRSLLTEPNQQLHAGNDSCDDELRNDAIEDIDLDVELLSWLCQVAVKVHHDVKSTPTHACIGNINQESAEHIVPKNLFVWVYGISGRRKQS